MLRSFGKTLGLLSAVTLLGMIGTAAAQNFPAKPLRVIVPYAPGGTTTTVMRIYSQRLSEAWGQNLVIDNMPGGNTIIGSHAMTRAPADGYTLLFVSNTHVITHLLGPKLPYDTLRDFAGVATLTRSGYILVVHSSVQASTIKELIALAKAKPGSINSAIVGTGTVNHLVSELFAIMTDIKIVHVPYKGSGPIITDLMGGQVQMFFAGGSSSVQLIKSGKVRAIAVTTHPERMAIMPDLPTIAESGVPGYQAGNWYALLAPAKTPAANIARVNADVVKAQSMADVREMLDKQGLEPFASTPSQLDELIRVEIQRYAEVIKRANIKAEVE